MTRHRLWVAVVAAGVVAVLSPLGAQEVYLQPGARIRVFQEDVSRSEYWQAHTGTLVEISDTALSLQTAAPAELHTIPLAQINRLEVSQGEKGNGIIGAIVGVPVGWFGAALFFSDDDPVEAGTGAIAGTLVGAAAGYLVGSLIKSERWKRVPIGGDREP
jgi:hypothetical protein